MNSQGQEEKRGGKKRKWENGKGAFGEVRMQQNYENKNVIIMYISMFMETHKWAPLQLSDVM